MMEEKLIEVDAYSLLNLNGQDAVGDYGAVY
jgi:hypothetical protein